MILKEREQTHIMKRGCGICAASVKCGYHRRHINAAAAAVVVVHGGTDG